MNEQPITQAKEYKLFGGLVKKRIPQVTAFGRSSILVNITSYNLAITVNGISHQKQPWQKYPKAYKWETTTWQTEYLPRVDFLIEAFMGTWTREDKLLEGLAVNPEYKEYIFQMLEWIAQGKPKTPWPQMIFHPSLVSKEQREAIRARARNPEFKALFTKQE